MFYSRWRFFVRCLSFVCAIGLIFCSFDFFVLILLFDFCRVVVALFGFTNGFRRQNEKYSGAHEMCMSVKLLFFSSQSSVVVAHAKDLYSDAGHSAKQFLYNSPLDLFLRCSILGFT